MSRDDLENLLRNHLGAELDAQRGRAARQFESRVIEPMRVSLATRNRRLRSLRTWCAVVSAMAACVALGFAVPRLLTQPKLEIAAVTPTAEISVPKTLAPLDGEKPVLEGLRYTSSQRTIDAGPALLSDGVPARRIIRQRVDQLRWRDPATGGRFEIIEPFENDLFVQVHQQ
ncbi:MAG: hypothetical protein H7144_11350 [Burkholderiales bacterium]|nr:hypothetical protein [Phycisphaerae bacterium]